MSPISLTEPCGRYLSLAEREEIAVGRAAGQSMRAIARRLGRHPSTISRELVRNRVLGGNQGGYRAMLAQSKAEARARRPKPRKLAVCPPLQAQVQAMLEQRMSPEQINRRLPLLFPDDQGMRVSHEVIYQSLYVHGKGGLRRELTTRLRTGRALRKPQRRVDQRGQRTRIPDMVMIADRPPEVEDRAVPGDWEGDLITGTANKSAIGTLVDRATRFVLLLHLPNGHGAVEVRDAIITAMADLPAQLRRSLTWDQGIEMAQHGQISVATDLAVYFCDPHSPWQRGTNENTNGLLRQYFPKSTDLSRYTADDLATAQAELNARPRKALGFYTPAETLARKLHEGSVATTP
ncbi:IS30 family transposase [Hamadaea sp. NPDC051192]|uniref:IS30 family transposase n=1 Tax=Hamadaea sp. NPDC051192 TaxID=3154940 RepID=UPI003424F6B2